MFVTLISSEGKPICVSAAQVRMIKECYSDGADGRVAVHFATGMEIVKGTLVEVKVAIEDAAASRGQSGRLDGIEKSLAGLSYRLSVLESARPWEESLGMVRMELDQHAEILKTMVPAQLHSDVDVTQEMVEAYREAMSTIEESASGEDTPLEVPAVAAVTEPLPEGATEYDRMRAAGLIE